MWHPILLVFNNEDRSSMYTANYDGYNITPCHTLLEVIKYGDVSAPHVIHSSSLRGIAVGIYQISENVSIFTFYQNMHVHISYYHCAKDQIENRTPKC